MSRNLDIILFGATGFTGKHAIPLLSKFSQKNVPQLTWGIAGRSEDKLKDLLSEYEKEIGTPLDNIPIVIASIEDEKSLKLMARQARIIINCCGPYRFYGEPVVKACIEECTHHVDVSGEPQYMETIQLKYHEAAKEKGIYIISSCGFDSIPVDLGVVFLQQNFSGTLNSVATYMKQEHEGEYISGSLMNYPTWESAVYGLADAQELKSIRRQLYRNKLPSCKPKLEVKTFPHKNNTVSGWICPFIGADRSVVKRTQYYFHCNESKRPIQVETYFILQSLEAVIGFIIFGFIASQLVKSRYGINLLLRNPEIFSMGLISRNPPSKEKLKTTRCDLTLYGEGWKEQLSDGSVNKAISAKITCYDPAYGAACVCVTLAAITVITETDKLPSHGGVYTPGYAFANTSLIKQLNDNGVTFEILPEKDLLVPSKL